MPIVDTNSSSRLGKRLAFILLSLSLIGFALAQVDTRDLGAQFARFPRLGVGLVVVALALNLGVVWLRFWRMLAHLGFRLRAADAWRAFLQGQLASLFVIQLVGQMAGRGLALARHGVSPAALAALSVYERGTLFVFSAALALAGALWLLGLAVLDPFLARLHLAEVTLIILLAAWGARLLGSSRHEAALFARAASWRVAGRLGEGVALTLCGQLLMLAAFAVAALALRPSADPAQVLAAAALISFAASLPISINGWGVREVAAMALLAPLGFPRAEALAVSILVGLAATLVMLAPMPLLLRVPRPVADATVTPPPDIPRDLDRLAAWALGGLAAFLILFQFHAKFSLGEISVNLADALALLGFGALLVEALLLRRPPRWRLHGVNAWALAASLVLLVAFAIGVAHMGVTAWALSNRLLGWFVLLGYAALGAWFVGQHGRHGLRRLVDYLAACAAAIVLAQITLRVLAGVGWAPFALTANFEGYAANRNAFAFQMLICAAGLLAWAPPRARLGRFSWHDLTLGIVLAGVWLSQSRAALGTAVVMLLLAWRLAPTGRAAVLLGVGLAAAVVVALTAWNHLAQAMFSHAGLGLALASPGYDSLRWDSIRQGLRLWLDAPLFGAGLGVFLHDSARWFEVPMVIHSTPVWWLAELGAAGFAVFAGGLLAVAAWGWRRGHAPGNAPARLALLLALAFAVFGLAHDIFAQRIFWFVLGAALAGVPYRRALPRIGTTDIVISVRTGEGQSWRRSW